MPLRRNIKILKNRSDIGAGTCGADLGIDAIEVAAINKGSDFFNRYPYVDIKTHNESIYNKVISSYAKRIRHVYEQCERVANEVKITLNQGFFPLVLSGDHSSALGTISGIKAAYPNKRIGVVWIDAHADLNTPYTTPSGNIHGMPLSAALGNDSLIWQVNEVHEETEKYWKLMQQIGMPGPKVGYEDIVFFGVRAADSLELKLMDKYGMKNYNVEELRSRGVSICISEALSHLKMVDLVYISVDIDSLDGDLISYGTGTPVPDGFNSEDLKQIISGIIAGVSVVGMEFVEVNPLLDKEGNKTAETAFDIIEYAICALQVKE